MTPPLHTPRLPTSTPAPMLSLWKALDTEAGAILEVQPC